VRYIGLNQHLLAERSDLLEELTDMLGGVPLI